MSSKKKALTAEALISKRKHYRKHTKVSAIIIGAVIFLLSFAYLFLYAAYNGYGYYVPIEFFQKWTWLKYLPYFKSSIDIAIWEIFKDFDANVFFKSEGFYRLLVAVGIVVLTICVPIVYAAISNRIHRKKYQALYHDTIAYLGKEKGYELSYESDKEKIGAADLAKTFNLIGAIDAAPSKKITFKTRNISWDGVQTTYTYQGKTRKGFLISTNLEDPKNISFVQLRNYGQALSANYNDVPLEKYGFADNNLLSRFVCYAPANENIYHFIDVKTAHAIFDIQHFLSSSIVINLADNNFSVFIDGFSLRIAHPLKEDITVSTIEEEVRTLAVLNKLFSDLAKCFSKEIIQESTKNIVE